MTFQFFSFSMLPTKKCSQTLHYRLLLREIDLFTRILKKSIDVLQHSLINKINCLFEQNEYRDDLKLAHLIPFYEKKDSLDKGNQTPESLLPHHAKDFCEID